MEPNDTLGFAHFLAQTDSVGRAIFAILIIMSITSWYLIIAKALQVSSVLQKKRSATAWISTGRRSLRCQDLLRRAGVVASGRRSSKLQPFQ
ncbi:MAG TPA: hypothetical protein VML56_11295, partial [Burkholderiales bacterium]|nr:hypothetical protein [Burkholderiales bacterium]